MNNFGQLFKMMRTARNLSLKEATGGEFSVSMLSRFENMQTDISAEKLFRCLDHIYLTVQEFEFLAREFQKSELTTLLEKLESYSNPFNLTKLEKLAQEELDKIAVDQKEQYHQLTSTLVRSRIKVFNETYPLNEQEINRVCDYLFSVDKWGQFELVLFSETVNFFDPEAYLYYIREMVHRSDFFMHSPQNSTLIQTCLLNGLFLFAERKELTSASYVLSTLKSTFGDTRDAYLKIVLLIAEGYYLWQKGEWDGKVKIEDGIHMFEQLNYPQQATYYREEFRDILEAEA